MSTALRSAGAPRPAPAPPARGGVVVLQPYPTPHRNALFRAIHGLVGESVQLCFLARGARARPWLAEADPEGFAYRFLSQGAFEERNWTRSARLAWRLLAGLRPDAIICGYEHPEYWSAFAWARLRGSRSICWMGTTGYERRSRLRIAVRNSLLRTVDDLLLYSRLTERFALSVGLGGRARLVLPNAADTSGFRLTGADRASVRSAQRQVLGIDPGTRVFLYAGRLSPEKNLGRLLEAFALCLGAPGEAEGGPPRLLLVGSGPCEPALRDAARRLSLERRIVWHPGVTPERLPSFFAAADVLVLLSEHEPWGIVVNEAAAMELPVVVSDRCGAAYHLFGGPLAELVVPHDSPRAIAAALCRLARDDEFRALAGRRLGENERRLGVEWMARQFLSFCAPVVPASRH